MRPFAGEFCAQCLRRGHKCQAQIYAEGVALCLPCADDEPCVVERVGAAPVAGADMETIAFEPAAAPGPIVHRAPEDLGLPRILAAEPEGGSGSLDHAARDRALRAGRAQGLKLHRDVEARRREIRQRSLRETRSRRAEAEKAPAGADVAGEETKGAEAQMMRGQKVDEKAVLAIAGTMSDQEVGRKIGCSGVTVGAIRRRHSIPKYEGKPSPRPQNPPAKNVAPADPAQLLKRHERRVAPRMAVIVGATIDAEAATAVFAALSPERMAIALNAVLADVLRGA